MTQKILLTGASGYVGSHLLSELRSRGHRVRALVRDPDRADLPADVQLAKGDAVKGTGLQVNSSLSVTLAALILGRRC